MEPNEAQKEHLTDLTVDVVMELRRSFLATGANPLSHWDQIESRLRAATRTSAGPEEWVTKLSRDLRLSAPSSSLSGAMEALTEEARRFGAARWLALVEREYAYMIAKARRLAEERRAERLAEQEKSQ